MPLQPLDAPVHETSTAVLVEPAVEPKIWFALDSWTRWQTVRRLGTLHSHLRAVNGEEHAHIVLEGEAPGTPIAQVIGHAPFDLVVELGIMGSEMLRVVTREVPGRAEMVKTSAIWTGEFPARPGHFLDTMAAVEVIWDWMRTSTTVAETEPAIPGPHRVGH